MPLSRFAALKWLTFAVVVAMLMNLLNSMRFGIPIIMYRKS